MTLAHGARKAFLRLVVTNQHKYRAKAMHQMWRLAAVPAASRSPSMRCVTRSASGRGSASASTFLGERAAPGDENEGLCAAGASISRCRTDPATADHHDRARHRRRAVPRLPAGAAGDQGARAATGCSSAISAATTTFSTRTSLPPCAPPGVLTRLIARLVARRTRR